ncbi:uncharacterized protein si:dkey-58f10.7 isoform X3 [Danio aesculapii]|uniref:uncharacterized protein si:dkey-58f10.7 isoform X3 n=1 Tax=Danio aesculapii TaxID=1142201 RepID=UPI0024BF91EB|nr:uncharacterized protein si:dkey-58f10.7 isoform X3 [Danio aesculapii]
MSQLQAMHGKYYYVIESGRSGNLRMQILSHLQQQRPNLEQVYSVNMCDVILVLCLITSRAGTDIDAALKKLNDLSAFKPAIFLVLHHTFDPERVVPDSSRVVKRNDTLTVDCLFNDTGLLRCKINDDALDKIVMHFKHQVIQFYIKDNCQLVNHWNLLDLVPQSYITDNPQRANHWT